MLATRKRNDVKRMTPKEFREQGYLQEVNRQFLHRIGLELQIVVSTDGNEHFVGIWDCRDDPEGIIFSPSTIDTKAAERISSEQGEKYPFRMARFGFDIQPER